MNYVYRFFSWLILSSKNPEKMSLTIKGVLALLIFIGIGNAESISQTSDAIVAIIVQIATFVSTGVAIVGAIRKVYYTWFKKNY